MRCGLNLDSRDPATDERQPCDLDNFDDVVDETLEERAWKGNSRPRICATPKKEIIAPLEPRLQDPHHDIDHKTTTSIYRTQSGVCMFSNPI